MFSWKFILKIFGLIFCIILIFKYFLLTKYIINHRPIKVLNYSNVNLFNLSLLLTVVNNNQHAKPINEDKFGELTNEDLVIVVQVHKRLAYLEKLIDSLRKVESIEETLIVFSHDYYDEQINQLIQSIQFAKAIQIFYPFSTQIWSYTFPGTSFNDCPRDISKHDALLSKCLNGQHPDSYGHYREASITQIKHHWWWKLYFVMEHLNATMRHKGHFLMIEEDHYFSADFLYMWKQMKSEQRHLIARDVSVDTLTLGNYEKRISRNVENDFNKVNITSWFSSKHNMAFTIDRILWSKIKLCQKEFCSYDDYNWDWSLQFIIDKCLQRKLSTLVSVIPRVYHIGTCGLHHTKCNQNKEYLQVVDSLEKHKDYLFPKKIKVQKERVSYKRKIKPNGGWGDPRDHRLCEQYEMSTEHILQQNSNFHSFRELNESFLRMFTEM